jgi:hypothetical protein
MDMYSAMMGTRYGDVSEYAMLDVPRWNNDARTDLDYYSNEYGGSVYETPPGVEHTTTERNDVDRFLPPEGGPL